MVIVAAHGADPPSSGWFLLVWCLLALPAGSWLLSRRGSAWFHDRMVRRWETGFHPMSSPPPVWGIRAAGALFALVGVVAIPFGIHLITR